MDLSQQKHLRKSNRRMSFHLLVSIIPGVAKVKESVPEKLPEALESAINKAYEIDYADLPRRSRPGSLSILTRQLSTLSMGLYSFIPNLLLDQCCGVWGGLQLVRELVNQPLVPLLPRIYPYSVTNNVDRISSSGSDGEIRRRPKQWGICLPPERGYGRLWKRGGPRGDPCWVWALGRCTMAEPISAGTGDEQSRYRH